MVPDTRTPKQRVYDHYDNQCAKCSERDPRKLCIDHVHNDGAKERRKGLRGDALCRHIIRTGTWIRYRLLCWNCNIARQRERERNRRRQRGEKPAVEKKQFSQRVSLVTHEYIAKVASVRGCSLAQAFEQIIQEHAAMAAAKKPQDMPEEPMTTVLKPEVHPSEPIAPGDYLDWKTRYPPVVREPWVPPVTPKRGLLNSLKNWL